MQRSIPIQYQDNYLLNSDFVSEDPDIDADATRAQQGVVPVLCDRFPFLFGGDPHSSSVRVPTVWLRPIPLSAGRGNGITIEYDGTPVAAPSLDRSPYPSLT